jgi:hypothetical protein
MEASGEASSERKRGREPMDISIRLGKRLKTDTVGSSEADMGHASKEEFLRGQMELLRSLIPIASKRALKCLQAVRLCMQQATQLEIESSHYETHCYDLGVLLRNYLLSGSSQHQIEALWTLSSRTPRRDETGMLSFQN